MKQSASAVRGFEKNYIYYTEHVNFFTTYYDLCISFKKSHSLSENEGATEGCAVQKGIHFRAPVFPLDELDEAERFSADAAGGGGGGGCIKSLSRERVFLAGFFFSPRRFFEGLSPSSSSSRSLLTTTSSPSPSLATSSSFPSSLSLGTGVIDFFCLLFARTLEPLFLAILTPPSSSSFGFISREQPVDSL